MAAKPKRTKQPSESRSDAPLAVITCGWSLAELPSPQHRAGLAGLVMLVDYTRRFPLPDGAVLESVHRDDVRFDLRLNQSGLRALFDRVYGAGIEERAYPKPWDNKTPIRTEVRLKTGKNKKTKETTVYIYGLVSPHGGPLADWSPPDDNGLWIKLWRNWLFDVVRVQPATKYPYDHRAGIRSQETPETSDAWEMLLKGGTRGLANHWMLGSMDVNAEMVPFEDMGRNFFLLHFWPFSVHLFVPEFIDADGERQQDGFAICIPDVSRLDQFVRRHIQVLQQRRGEAGGFRPRQALIELPDAAALQAEEWFVAEIAKGVDQNDAPATAGFQVVHAAKEGNSVRIRSNRIIAPTRDQRQHAKVINALGAHLTKRQVLENILAGTPWWSGFDRICATWSKYRTILDKAFCYDVRTLFERYHPKDRTMSNSPSSTNQSHGIESLVLRIVQGWLRGRMQSKHQIDMKTIWELAKEDSRREDAEKKNGKLATEAFLAARSRPGREFSRWFTATLCSVNHYLSDTDFVTIAKALEERPEHVRTLTLLALSARG